MEKLCDLFRFQEKRHVKMNEMTTTDRGDKPASTDRYGSEVIKWSRRY